MEQNLINAEISTADLAEVDAAIETMKAKLPFLISLSPEEKNSLFKVGENYKPMLPKVSVAQR